MNAFKCDCCGNLSPLEDTVQIIVSLDLEEDAAGSVHTTEWKKVDICGPCMQRPLEDVLAEACLGFNDAWKGRKKE